MPCFGSGSIIVTLFIFSACLKVVAALYSAQKILSFSIVYGANIVSDSFGM
jgi:hypothetical protein